MDQNYVKSALLEGQVLKISNKGQNGYKLFKRNYEEKMEAV